MAVKELLENSLDAEATRISINLTEYGSECIEIIDNGTGILPADMNTFALKSHTSKLSNYSDLFCLETFGFRGEALSSLCALSEVCVVTRHKREMIGSKITFDCNGCVKIIVPQARTVGTTVRVAKLFCTLPIRRKIFCENLSKEFNKMSHLLTAYCLLNGGVAISCYNRTAKGGGKTVLSVCEKSTARSNVISIFGSKQAEELIEIKTELLLDNVGMDSNKYFKLEGFISSCEHNCGRNCPDRQFFYINSRPCEMKKIGKLVNSTYRQYNAHKYPFLILNVVASKYLYNVNVTPDKRTILLQKEEMLMELVEHCLRKIFDTTLSTYKVNRVDLPLLVSIDKQNVDVGIGREKSINMVASVMMANKRKCEQEDNLGSNISFDYSLKSLEDACYSIPKKTTIKSFDPSKSDPRDDGMSKLLSKKNEHMDDDAFTVHSSKSVKRALFVKEIAEVENQNHTVTSPNSSAFLYQPYNPGEGLYGKQKVFTKIILCLNWHADSIKRNVLARGRSSASYTQSSSDNFSRKIQSLEVDDAMAEDKLATTVTTDTFKKMKIVGQFNLGFIIVRLNSHLFIVDQHAADEIYNFETLQKKKILKRQLLVQPQIMDLTASNECLLMQNMEMFKENGFEFDIDVNAKRTNQVKLISIPSNKDYHFGKEDVEEMLYLLQEGSVNNTQCRPSRIRAMFASRACRMSVMIGTALDDSKMKRVIHHMGEIERPWNCPHGRPTMRHLIDLDPESNKFLYTSAPI